jgi:hypothetical protein
LNITHGTWSRNKWLLAADSCSNIACPFSSQYGVMALMSDAGYYWLGNHKFWPLSKAASLHSRIYETNDKTEIVDCCRRPDEWSVVVVFVLWILLSPLTFRLRLQYVPTWIWGTLSFPTMLPRRRKNKAGRARAVHLLGTESRYHLFILERTFLLMLDPVGRSLSQ